MSAGAPVAAPVVLALALVLLLLCSWEAGADRRGGRVRARRRALMRGPALTAVHDAQEVRLAAWFFFAALVWWRAAGCAPLQALAGWSPYVLLAAGSATALLLVALGWRLGGRSGLATGVRWILAPFHGLSMWLLWIWAGLERRLAGGPRNGSGLGPEADRAASGPSDSARRGVLDLASLTVEELMIPRSQVAALEGRSTVAEAIQAVAHAPHELYPVYGETVDQPLGVLRILDLAPPEDPDRPVRDLVRPARIVPETMKGLNLLRDLAAAPLPAALVVDEFGGMAGFVTVEDLIEVLVGDLVGEHEVVRSRILPLAPGVYRVDGTAEVDEFNERFGPLLPAGQYETVAGLFLDHAGRIPQEGDSLDLPGVRLEVVERTERRILALKAEIRSSPAAPAASAPP